MDENKGFKMKGSSLYGKLNLNRSGYENMPDGREKSSAFQKKTDPQKYEGAETMGSEQLKNEFGIEGLGSSTDYYIKRGDQNEPMILGEVELDAGTKSEVTGVPGSKGGKLTRKDD